MGFKEDIKIKDYFMKDYSREEILRTFTFILKRIEKTGEIEGNIENTKITRNKWRYYNSRNKNKR